MPASIAELASALSHPDPIRRAAAAEELARMGAEAHGAAVPLVRACGDDEAVREWAVAALEELGPPSADDTAALAELVSHESADVGYWATTLLGRLGERAVPAVTALAAALAGPRDPAVRQRAAWALGQIGPPASDAAAALERAAASDDPRLATLARQALERVRRR